MALNLQNAKEKFINALFGVPAQTEGVAPNVSYGEKVDEYLNGLGSQPYMQGLLKQPKETGLTLDQYKQGVANGLNYGVPEIAQAQKELGINIPKTGEEIDLANVGQFNQPTGLSVGTATTPRQGGFLNDLASGYQENATQGFNVQNLAPDQNKGLATRIGEGLGTLTRFANSPLGRGLIAYGTTRALGYDDPVEQGLIAGVTRQGNISRDKAYRQGLINMGVDEAQVNAIPGIVSNDIFANFARAKQLQDNAEYRNMMLQNQQAQNELMNQYRQDQLQYQRMQDVQDRAMKEREFNYRASQDAFDNYIASENLKAKQKEGKTNVDPQKLSGVQKQLENFDSIFKNVDNPYRFRTFGGVSKKLNTYSPEESNFMSQANLLFNIISRDLGGEKGVLSDQDIQRIKDGMPTLSDTIEQKRAKMSAIYGLLEIKLKQAGIDFENPYDIYGRKKGNTNTDTQTEEVNNNEEGWAF